MSSTKLTSGYKQVDIVTANEILGHVDDGSCNTSFTMMIFGNTSNVISQLSDLIKEDQYTHTHTDGYVHPMFTLTSVFLDRLMVPNKTLR